ncbi:MAG TPA: GGDEF domain-containing protein [Edaphobacter sp.]
MDRLTLFSMQGGLLVFMGLVVYAAGRMQKRATSDNAHLWFSIGFAFGGVGMMLQAYRGVIPAVFSILMGNGLFLLVYIFMEKAIAVTTRRRSYALWLLALDAALVTNYAYFTYIKPDVIVRTIEAVIVMPLMQVPIWFHLLRCKERTIRPALRAMAIVLATLTLMDFGLILGVVLMHMADVWFAWIGVVSIAGMSISFMWVDWLRVRDELERQALTDPLTGLLNRRALEDFGARELSRAARTGAPYSALTLDINKFKQINDTYGHTAGDKALIAVSAALLASLRLTDVATRVGGDEFFVLLPDSDERAAAEVSSRLRRAIESTIIESANGRVFRIAVSIGQVTSRGKTTIAELFHLSDMKLYDEKIARKAEAAAESTRLRQVTTSAGEASESGVIRLSNA